MSGISNHILEDNLNSLDCSLFKIGLINLQMGRNCEKGIFAYFFCLGRGCVAGEDEKRQTLVRKLKVK